LTDVTPDIFSSVFLTVIGQTEQVMFFTSRVTFSEVPANRWNGSAAKTLKRARRYVSDSSDCRSPIRADKLALPDRGDRKRTQGTAVSIQ